MQGALVHVPRSIAVLLAVVALTTSCGSDPGEDEEPQSRLELSVRADENAKPRTGTLICPGEKPKARDICAALEVVAPKVFEPVPVDQPCTAIYGGPRKATVSGTYEDETVSATFTQENGCEIARWNQIEPVLEALGLMK